MLERMKRFVRRLHEDESGPNTVEWVLLIIVALVVLAVIYFFVNWLIDKFKENVDVIDDQETQEDPFGG